MTSRSQPECVPLRLGAAVQFRDRWQGRLAAVEVDEAWEVLNLVIRRGLFGWSSSVKLPFSAARAWSDERVTFDCTSRQAFSREVPPVAAPAWPLSANTPISLPGAGLSGLLVEPTGRRVSDVIVARGGGRKNRVPVSEISFEGNVMRIAAQAENLALYLTDEELSLRVIHVLGLDGVLTGEERASVSADVSSGAVTLKGNVRTKRPRERIAELAARVEGATALRSEVVDDIELELEIGQGLSRSGLQRGADVYARSTLGDVTLFGSAPSVRAVDDMVRVISRVPGVRRVRSRIKVGAPAAEQSLR